MRKIWNADIKINAHFGKNFAQNDHFSIKQIQTIEF